MHCPLLWRVFRRPRRRRRQVSRLASILPSSPCCPELNLVLQELSQPAVHQHPQLAFQLPSLYPTSPRLPRPLLPRLLLPRLRLPRPHHPTAQWQPPSVVPRQRIPRFSTLPTANLLPPRWPSSFRMGGCEHLLCFCWFCVAPEGSCHSLAQPNSTHVNSAKSSLSRDGFGV